MKNRCHAITKRGNQCKRKSNGSMRVEVGTREAWCQFCDKHLFKYLAELYKEEIKGIPCSHTAPEGGHYCEKCGDFLGC